MKFPTESAMPRRQYFAMVIAIGAVVAAAFGQSKPAADSQTGLAGSVSKEVKGLSSDDFPERQAALAHLQALVADQLKQRAQIQEILSALQGDLAKQQKALAMVSNDEEAQAQIAGLLEMERGLAGWTAQTLDEPLERRTVLLNWGLNKERAGALARVYAQSRRARVEGMKELAKLPDDGVDWTLGRLINDSEAPIRAQAMAIAWNRKPAADIVAALWYRAVSGPQGFSARNAAAARFGGDGDREAIKVEFPGDADPMMFSEENDGAQFLDSQLAGDVLVHLHSDVVAAKVKALVAEQIKAGKTLSSTEDPDWTLVAHRLVETYKVKEAIPILVSEALSNNTEQMGGSMNGRDFMWSGRTMAIGTFCTLVGMDPADFTLIRAHDTGESHGSMWAVDMGPNAQPNGQPDAAAVSAFFTFWKAHHAEYGVKDEPQPSPIRNIRGRGRGVQLLPAPNAGP